MFTADPPGSFPGFLPHRVLGVDLGAKRLGLALSDPLGFTAQPLAVLSRQGIPGDLEQLAEVVAEHQVQEIVIGLPRHLDGRLGAEAQEALLFAQELRQRLQLPVHTLDERLTTAQAERVLLAADLSRRRRRQVVDKMAAAIILQTFLDSRSRTG